MGSLLNVASTIIPQIIYIPYPSSPQLLRKETILMRLPARNVINKPRLGLHIAQLIHTPPKLVLGTIRLRLLPQRLR